MPTDLKKKVQDTPRKKERENARIPLLSELRAVIKQKLHGKNESAP